MLCHLRAYSAFCIYFDKPMFPTTFQVMSAYIQCLGNSFQSSTSILNYVQTIKTLHKLLDHEFPDTSSFLFKLQIRGLARTLQHMPKQAQPVDPHTLIKCYHLLALHTPLHQSVWSAFTIAFFTMARLSNLVPASPTSFDPSKHLTRADVVVTGDTMMVAYKWSKTNQYGARQLVIPLVSIPDHPLCPVSAFNNLLTSSPASPTDSAFSYKQGHLTMCLTQSRLIYIFRTLLSKLGMDSSLYSGHSFRRSGATWAFLSGVRSELIKHQGDWKSDCYLRYLSFTIDQRTQVSHQMASAIVSH
jgi:hypothetical protein